MARFSFNVLTISLIYSTTAIAVSPQSIGDYWFVFVGAFAVISISYLTATILGYVFRINNPRDFCALRIAASFPNIVSLPILIFPSLCEYSVVNESLIPDSVDEADRRDQCVALSNTMIFCYFFAYSLVFFSFGQPQLMAAARMKSSAESERTETDAEVESTSATDTERVDTEENQTGFAKQLIMAVEQVFSSLGFQAMLAGFITGCIPPLQQALFDEGGPLRFLGSSVQTLGMASSPLSTLIAAASLVPPTREVTTSTDNESDSIHEIVQQDEEDEDESPIMSDPHYGPLNRRRRRSIQRFAQSIRESAESAVKGVTRTRSDTLRLLAWFVMSRLVLSPAIVTTVIVALDGTGLLAAVPPMAKLVVLINSCLPGAQMIVVLLKSQEELADSAQAVAAVYLPSYLISCVTIAAWSSIGLWLLNE